MMSSYFSVIVKRHHDQSDLQKKAFTLGLRVPEGGRAYSHHVGVSQLGMAQGFETLMLNPTHIPHPQATHLHQSHASSSKATPPPAGDQVFRHTSLWGYSHSDHHT